MSRALWIPVLLAAALGADYGWTGYRDWRARRTARKEAQTLTRKFALPPE